MPIPFHGRWRCILLVASALAAGCRTQPPVELYGSAIGAINAGDWPRARALTEELLRTDPEPGDHLLLAIVEIGEKRNDLALEELARAIDTGASDPGAGEWTQMLREDEAWQPVRADPRFAALVAKAERMRWKPDVLVFDGSPSARPDPTRCSPRGNDYLARLRTGYALDAVVAGAADDLDRVKRICRWVHGRCGHSGWPSGLPDDPIGLLDAAAKGAQFRCVEFGVAVAGCLQAVGVPARVVGARSRDVETRRVGAGHVFAEAWLADRGTWVFVDAQMDLVGQAADGRPLDAVAFRNALALPKPPVEYPTVLSMCMYYFTYGTDARYPVEARERGSVMLAPIGAPEPHLFQREPTTPPTRFTHRPADVTCPPRTEGTP